MRVFVSTIDIRGHVYMKDLRSGFTLPFIPSPQGRGNSREPPLKGGGKKE